MQSKKKLANKKGTPLRGAIIIPFVWIQKNLAVIRVSEEKKKKMRRCTRYAIQLNVLKGQEVCEISSWIFLPATINCIERNIWRSKWSKEEIYSDTWWRGRTSGNRNQVRREKSKKKITWWKLERENGIGWYWPPSWMDRCRSTTPHTASTHKTKYDGIREKNQYDLSKTVAQTLPTSSRPNFISFISPRSRSLDLSQCFFSPLPRSEIALAIIN